MSSENNITLLTQSHRAIAAKKKAKREQIKEVVFDEDARREFLTGFHKRKVAKAEAAKKRYLERKNIERLDARKEQRRALRERAQENAAQVERAYGATFSEGEADEWTGIHISDSEQGGDIDHEYEGEEELATVTVVEDFDIASFGPMDITKPGSEVKDGQSAQPKKIRYQTKNARKHERPKQRGMRMAKTGSRSRKRDDSKR
ncbi:hypothetical protein AX17_004590 [Amanita inopinata Kibby_2008]|nr:hypothetical protein AX17_004590 [Amanita inopinata Kibby_2008]